MVSGFTIVRNAQRLDYPFVESVRSVLPLCDEFIINLGDSSDDTEALVAELAHKFPEKIKVIRSIWDLQKQKGGWQLKNQTDRALQECRGDWCFYIQADEVFPETDRSRLEAAMAKADGSPEIDGVLFDYVHFYGGYGYEIRGRNWYRREVRLFKNRRGISAYRDAQGFRIGERRLSVFNSGARIFHYGYVRNSESLHKKDTEMSQWWGRPTNTHPAAAELKRHFGLRKFEGQHPVAMTKRIATSGNGFEPRNCPRVWNRDEIKNLVTLWWETLVPYRIGEYRNYEIKG